MNDAIPDINGYKNRLMVIQKVAEQLEKDLQLNQSIPLSGDPDKAYPELEQQVQPLVKNWLQQDYSWLMHTLYRIDVSEKKLARARIEFSDMPEHELITHLILERELQKVVLRMWYSKTLDS
ncbi:hypothetical protein KFE98_05155 [bacterium SCSIO 12741]|nr:hypothetical protein KFE98_05155 [bacterium SCSIO 12741]